MFNSWILTASRLTTKREWQLQSSNSNTMQVNALWLTEPKTIQVTQHSFSLNSDSFSSVKELLAMCYDYTGKSAPWRTKFWEPRSTALYPNPRYNEARYKEGRLYITLYYMFNTTPVTTTFMCHNTLMDDQSLFNKFLNFSSINA